VAFLSLIWWPDLAIGRCANIFYDIRKPPNRRQRQRFTPWVQALLFCESFFFFFFFIN